MSVKVSLTCLLALLLVCATLSLQEVLDKKGEIATEAAHFALDELMYLSDSGVYSSLSLAKIVSAKREEDGIFHENIMMSLELSSPYFKSGLDSEIFEMIVMKHKDDGVKSLAIDEFPVMSEVSIESFWIQKTRMKKMQREESFRRLEVETLLRHRLQAKTVLDLDASAEVSKQMKDKTVEMLLDMVDSDASKKSRMQRSISVQRRLQQPFAEQEMALSGMKLSQLYKISISVNGDSSTHKYTHFQIERARNTIDDFMQESSARI